MGEKCGGGGAEVRVHQLSLFSVLHWSCFLVANLVVDNGIKAGMANVPDVLRGSAFCSGKTGSPIPPIRSTFPSLLIDRTIELMDERIMSQS